MTEKQETLIYIEQDNKTEAEFMSRSFVKGSVKNRAYINALGAELVMKYLRSEGIDTNNVHNIHSISKILEQFDVSDILLPNIHIDVRVVFDENQIFIPKSHFEYGLVPDAYAVLKLSKDFSYVEFLGYFEPKILNKRNENKDYYFIEKEKLFSPATFTKFVKDFVGNTSRGMDHEDFIRGRELSVAMADHNISDEDLKEFLGLLLSSDSLRDTVLEFDNFETLSYSVAPSIEPIIEAEVVPVAETAEEGAAEEEEETSQDENQNPQEEETTTEEDTLVGEDEIENSEIDFSTTEEQELTLDDDFFNMADDSTSLLEEDVEAPESVSTVDNSENVEEAPISELPKLETLEETTSDVVEPLEAHEDLTFDNSLLDLNGEDLLNDDNFDIESEPVIENSDNVDSVQEENHEDTVKDEVETKTEEAEEVAAPKEVENPLEKAIGNALKKSLETTATAAATAGAAAVTANAASAASAIVEGVQAAGAVSQEAIKLANVSGDIVKDLVNKNLESQQKNLDRIDYAKSTTNANDVPEHIAAYDLSEAKIEANIEAEVSGQFDSPTDLDSLQQVNTKPKGYGDNIEQETIDLNEMESFELEKFEEDDKIGVVDLEDISQINSPTTPVKNLDEKLNSGDEGEKMDLPDLSSFVINDDGTSNMDNFDINLGHDEPEEEGLLDFNMGSPLTISSTNEDDLTLDDDFTEDLLAAVNSDKNEQSEPENKEDKHENSDSEEEILPLAEESLDLGDNSDLDMNLTLDEDITSSPLEEEPLVEETSTEAEVEPTSIEDTISSVEEEPSLEIPENSDDVSLNISEEPVLDEGNISEITESENETSTPDFTVEDDEISLEDIDFENTLAESLEPQQDEEIPTVDEELPTEVDEEEFKDEETVPQNQAEEVTTQESDWLEEPNYDNLQDVELPPETSEEAQNPEELSDEDFITEEPPVEKVYNAVANSTVISDTTFKAGEIPIDINNPELPQIQEGPEQLEELYDDNSSNPTMLQNPGRLTRGRQNNNGGLALGLGLVGVVIVIIIVGIIGFSVSKMVKSSKEEAPEPITDTAIPTSSDNGVNDSNTLNVDQNNVVNMDNSNLPAATTTAKPKQITSTAAPKTVGSASKQIPATSYLEVQKISWEVPDYVSRNANFRQYFQSAGKSLKLSLTSDLLLATDYAYSDQVRVSVLFDKDGAFKDAKILVSSGSSQIDSIVLQTVNQTLKVLKAPHSIGNDESTTVILKIYL